MTLPLWEGLEYTQFERIREYVMYELILEGMTCSHCAKTVEKAVLSAEPSSKPSVDLDIQKVTVDNGDIEKISQAIEDSGYSVVSTRKL